MDQLLQQQHAQSGTGNFSEKELKDTLGGILSFIKSKLGSVDFQKIQSAIPQTEELVTEAETSNARAAGEGGGASNLLSSAMGMLGGQQGGGGSTSESDAATTGEAGSSASAPINSMTQLLGYMGKMGIDPKQAMAFLPVVAKFLQENAGVDVSSALGTAGTTDAAAGDTTGAAGGESTEGDAKPNEMVGNLMNKASGFMSSFGGKK